MKYFPRLMVLFTLLMFFIFGTTTIEAAEDNNLLLNKDVTFSGVENGKNEDGSWKYPQFVGEKAVDGNSDTRWSAAKEDEQWLMVDIGESVPVGEIYLDFHAESPDYEILISDDGESFETVHHETEGSDGKKITKNISLKDKTARYIKYKQNKMWKHSGNGQYYGSSLISIKAYAESRKPESISLDQESISLSEGRNTQLSYTVEPEGLEISEEKFLWNSEDEDIATVQDGQVTAESEGKTDITLQVEDTDLIVSAEVVVTQTKEDYELMRERWKERLLVTDRDANDPDINAYLNKISKESEKLWETLNKKKNRDYLWERKESDTVSADYTTQFENIKKLTLGYYEPTSAIYQNSEVKQEIINAIDFMIDTKQYNGTYWTGNWWDWQIGSTHALVDTLILLHDDLLHEDYEKLQKFVAPIKGYASDPKKQWPNYRATGANLTDISISVLGSAILLEDDSRVQLVEDSVPEVLKKVTNGDGLYTDGSVIQHNFFPYNGSYGNELLKGVGRIQSILTGTDWEINDSNMSNLYNVVDKGYLQLMSFGKMPSMVSGRSIARAPGTNPFTSEFESGKETIANLSLIAKFAPENLKNKIHSHIKQWVEDADGYFNFYKNPRDFEALIDLKNIVEDDNIVADEDETTLNNYASMDRVFKKTPNYSIGISMYSNRIANYEFGNTENKHGWHTADGMLYLYNGDLAQFDEGYWTTIDPYRLPGTTVDTRELPDGANNSVKSPQKWVGGTTDGQIASIGMHLDKSNEGTNLTAKKSWFLLDGNIINLGSGISGDTDASIETIIDNRMINKDKHSITVNGQSFSGDQEDVNGWVNINANRQKNNVGYVIPENMENVSMYEEERTVKYTDINDMFVSDKEYNQDYLTITNNHGKSVENGTYEYMIVPSKSNQELEAIAEKPNYKVLKNNSHLQAIESDNLTLVNFWEAGEVNSITANNPASVIAKKEGGILKLSVSDPTQTQNTVTVTLDQSAKQVIEKDESIKVVQTNPMKVKVDVANSQGKTHSIKLVTNEINTSFIKDVLDEHQKEISSEKAYRQLKTHLASVGHFENRGNKQKVVKHMKGFKQLLNHQKENDLISNDVYHILKMNTDAMIKQLLPINIDIDMPNELSPGNQDAKVTVTNNGDLAQSSGQFTLSVPEGWEVEPSNVDIPALEPGDSHTFNVKLWIAGDTTYGDNQMTAKFKTDNITRESFHKFRVTPLVEPPENKTEKEIKSVAASTSQTGHPPADTIDEDLATRWSAEGNGEWIQYNLGSVEKIEDISVAFYKGDKRSTTFDIKTSVDGENWESIFNGESSGTTKNLERYPFRNVEAKYVRILGYGNTNNNWNSITEIKVYGH